MLRSRQTNSNNDDVTESPLLGNEPATTTPLPPKETKRKSNPNHTRPDLSHLRTTEGSNLHGILWFIGSILLYQFTDFPNHLINSDRINRPFLYAGLACLGTNIAIALYLVVWVRWIQKIRTDWEIYSPYSIPVATFCGAASLILLSIAIWPVWGLFSPFMLIILFMGLISFLRVLPF